ncbi:TetR/AcrR family transcriptional regulator [Streptococcus equi]|uniref:TetR/AcrR family transcriptional regulator n=1 Tax=Streptococcus equi TaxID=1336 RepID=UPI000658431B|nr:TetR/AcrR family transcriptional regulator [Streptococcus equi]MCD3538837.1 TetR/AcrR family transcriptional regulator [Streptococcus equi subsp. equi]MCD3560410.1 TetR/AcrR family transcriptional regulator [Streptococcus equi subsp. equi]MCD3562587.1 TetR/AcrR family transcriptional regulator [Streptococcus equi subsp. equi]NBK65550.1 TetR/AcrR family transcriptional regulator [Streptococcus equi]NBL32683.1 TetR/AcrR family transcriptional regulator [Streptococcus equi]
MAGKPISKQSLQNLAHCNQESRRLTREAIEIALLSLLEKKPLGHITISELVARAGVSRNAFYRNYSSKEDILECLLTSVIRRIFRGLKAFDLKTQAYQAWLYLFTEAKKEATLLSIIFNHHLQQLLTQMVTKRLRAYQKWQEKKLSHYALLFWSNAIVSVLSNWISDDMIVPAEEMAAMGLPLLA